MIAFMTMASYAHKRVSETATVVSTDTIYYNADYIRVNNRVDAAYGRLLLTEGTGKNKREVFRDYYMNGKLKLEGGYSFIDLNDDRNTKVEGDVTAFYPNGKEKYRGSFIGGKPEGYLTVMMRDGSIATAEFVIALQLFRCDRYRWQPNASRHQRIKDIPETITGLWPNSHINTERFFHKQNNRYLS